MPNHVHGIIILNENETDSDVADGGTGDFRSDGFGANDSEANGSRSNVETGHALSLRNQNRKRNHNSPPNINPPPLPQPIGRDRFQNQGKNTLSSIVGSYKSAVTKHANRLGMPHSWQVRFHDHIIRDQESFERIQTYILNNPRNWQDDKFYGK